LNVCVFLKAATARKLTYQLHRSSDLLLLTFEILSNVVDHVKGVKKMDTSVRAVLSHQFNGLLDGLLLICDDGLGLRSIMNLKE
jgi:hypothetical protein